MDGEFFLPYHRILWRYNFLNREEREDGDGREAGEEMMVGKRVEEREGRKRRWQEDMV